MVSVPIVNCIPSGMNWTDKRKFVICESHMASESGSKQKLKRVEVQLRQPSDCHDFLPTAWGATPYHWLLQVKAFLSREVKMEEMKDRVKMILILTCNFFCIWISVRGRRSELPRPNRIILKLIHSGKKDFQNLCSDNEKCISGGLCWPQPWPSGPSLASFLASPSLA